MYCCEKWAEDGDEDEEEEDAQPSSDEPELGGGEEEVYPSPDSVRACHWEMEAYMGVVI